jgi:spermidine/putrescine transport system permease protein
MAKRRREWVLPTYTALVIAYLFIPTIVMVVYGFNDFEPYGRFNFVWRSPTLEHYRTLFEDPDLVEALKNSVLVALVAMVIATTLGTMIALSLTRFQFRGRAPINLLIFLPMSSPEIVLGVALLGLFVTLNIDRGFWTIVISHIMFSISFVVVTVKARTAGFDRNLEDAAADLGASPWVGFWTVTFPLIWPGILAAGALTLILSVDDYVITTFNAGATITFPLWIAGVSRFGIPAQVNVMGTLIFLMGIIYVAVNLARSRAEA